MKFRGDERELLRRLWSAVQSSGGSPSVNMIQKMARLAGASFDDKAARAVLAGDCRSTDSAKATPQYVSTITEATPRHNAIKSNNDSSDDSRTGADKAAPQYLSTITEASPRRKATKNNDGDSSGNSHLGVTEATPQYISGITNASPKFGFGENDETMVIDAPAPNLFDGLVDPLKLEPMNDAATLAPEGGAAPQELPAPGIARLMELAKKAKAVNAAAAMRAEAKAAPKAIRYIFPSERKT
jgi:hypothetical protein